MSVKLIIFDLSNVCFNNEETPFFKKFAERHGLDSDKVEEVFYELAPQAEMGEETGKKALRHMLKKFGIEEDPDEMIEEMIDYKEAKPKTLEFAQHLRKNYKVIYFTNYNRDFWKAIEERFDMDKYFDEGLVSYQAKSRKPLPGGFKLLMDRYNVKPEETIFLDDKEGNLKHAKEMDINTIHFKSLDQLKEEMRKLGVKTD